MKRAILYALFALCAVVEGKKKLLTGRADLATGKKLLENYCGLCHGPAGEGGRGPILAKARLSSQMESAAPKCAAPIPCPSAKSARPTPTSAPWEK
jgi:mono/diheme cytochrome c family protein